MIFNGGRNICKKINQDAKDESGVSPVVGVMLVLVVTIVIAAVVILFATGVIGGTEPAFSSVVLEAVVDSAWSP